jgi:hypothetical protein
MDARNILGAVGLFFGFCILFLFGMAILGGSAENLDGTIPVDLQPTYDVTLDTINTSISLSQYIPYLLILIVIVTALLSLGIIKMRR